MNSATVSLAELVSRGMNSIQQGTTSALPAQNIPLATQRKPLAATTNADVEKLLKTTNGLVERLTRLPQSASNDMPAMRRYILHSVEYFIAELSANR